MTDLVYPAEHFPGTPKLGVWVIETAIHYCGVNQAKWQVPLEAIARYETGFNPYRHLEDPPSVCPDCKGMMQQSIGQYAAHEEAFGWPPGDYTDPVLAVVCAIRYIKSELPGYGGYGNIGPLLDRTDRGPGEVLRRWIANPSLGYGDLRKWYRGY